MGHRLHVASKYKVEYALGDGFNYKVSEFHDLLASLGAVYTGDSWDDDFEVSKSDWQQAIDKLKTLDSLDIDERNDIESCLKELECNTAEVIGKMEYYLQVAEPDSDYLHLSFF